MTTHDNDKAHDAAERELFEAWATPRALRFARQERPDGDYASVTTQEAWEAWLARSALTASEAKTAVPEDIMAALRKLHVGDSRFEGWFSEYQMAHKGTKQIARDAYAAGMEDPMVATALASTPDGWVSVSDRLPEPHTTVIVWREDSGPFLAKRIAYCDVEDAGSDSDEIAWLADQYGWQEGSEEPTHWMPTPPAP